MTRAQAIGMVVEFLCGDHLGEEIALRILHENSEEWNDVAVFRLQYLFGCECILAGIEEYGYIVVEDIDGFVDEERSVHIRGFVERYFDETDLLRDCNAYELVMGGVY